MTPVPVRHPSSPRPLSERIEDAIIHCDAATHENERAIAHCNAATQENERVVDIVEELLSAGEPGRPDRIDTAARRFKR